MPVLRVLALERNAANRLIQLVQEAELGAHAKVADGKETELLEDEFARELDLNGRARQEVLEGERRNLHDVADVEGIYPLVLVEVAQDVLHVGVAYCEVQPAPQPRVCLLLARLCDLVWLGWLA